MCENVSMKELKSAKINYEMMRDKIAEQAYHEIKEVIDKWEKQDDFSFEFFWDEVFEIDDFRYEAEDFEGK